MTTHTLYIGDALEVLKTLPDESVHCVVTSPPYWGLRDYGIAGQIGLERTPKEYVAAMVEVFREVRRVLRKDGTCWLNLGDSYAGGGNGRAGKHGWVPRTGVPPMNHGPTAEVPGLKRKDLVGVPWRVAFALQEDGWWLRSEIIWAKPNPMPQSVSDRPTVAHEHIFLLTRAPHYYYDAAAVREPAVGDHHREAGSQYTAPGQKPHRGLHRQPVPAGWDSEPGAHGSIHRQVRRRRGPGNWGVKSVGIPGEFEGRGRSSNIGHESAWRNKRDVWEIPTQAFPGAHFATFPEAIVEPCILAGSPQGGGNPGSLRGRRYGDARCEEARPQFDLRGPERRLRQDRRTPLLRAARGLGGLHLRGHRQADGGEF